MDVESFDQLLANPQKEIGASMPENTKYEDQEKDRILQVVNDTLESLDWGARHERVIVKIILKGKFQLMEPEIDLKIKKRNENSAFVM